MSRLSNNIGGEIKRVRESLGLTLMEFGERVGIPWQTIAHYESGAPFPRVIGFCGIVHAARKADVPFRVEQVARAVALAA